MRMHGVGTLMISVPIFRQDDDLLPSGVVLGFWLPEGEKVPEGDVVSFLY